MARRSREGEAVRAEAFHERVFAVVARIPRGRVASYKLVGTLAGSPNSARQVGRIMRLAKGVPWWRVLAQDGRIVLMRPPYRYEQVLRLRDEGIEVSDEGRVDYERYAWRPRSLKRARTSRARAAPRRPR